MLKDFNKTAITYKDDVISFKQLLENVNAYSKIYKSKNIQKVALYAENRPEWVYTFYSTLKIDAISVPIDYLSTPKEVSYILKDCQPDVFVYSNETKDAAEKATKTAKIEIIKINLDELEINTQNGDSSPLDVPDKMKTAVIIYTSGTTGSPKGVMLSYDNLITNIQAVSQDVPIFTIKQRLMVLLPLHHTFPLLGSMMAPLYVGASIHFAPGMTADAIMKTLQNHKVTMIIGVPRLYTLLRNGIKDKINQSKIAKFLFNVAKLMHSRGFSKAVFKTVHQKFGGHIDYLISGGAALDVAVEKDYRTLGFEILSGFGMTEAAPMITFPRPGKTRIGSTGQPLFCNEVRIKEGEIVTKGRNVMQGYFNRPEETADVIIDGWLHTGDIGYLDKDNYLFITGRKKEIIVLPNGKNVNPVEIEFQLQGMTNTIKEIGVFYHDSMLQAVILPDFEQTEHKTLSGYQEWFSDTILKEYNTSVSVYKRLKRVTAIREELPRTRLQKLKRFKLQDLLKNIMPDEETAGKPVTETQEYSVIRDFIRGQVEKDIFPNDHIELDIGLDSLDKVNLQVFLKNTFDVDISEIHLEKYPTVQKLSEYIKDTSEKMKVEFHSWSEILNEKVNITLPKSGILHPMLKHISKRLLRWVFHLDIRGLNNLPESPYILAPNHQSFMDGLLIMVAFDNTTLRKTFFYAKAKHVKRRWVKSLAKRNNVIVVDLNNDVKLSIQKLAAVLKQEKNVAIFPEGTRSLDGQLGNFKKTFAILSKELNVPVVPVAIDGAYNALPTGKKLPKFKTKIKVDFMKPIYPETLKEDDIVRLTKEAIEKALD